MNIQINDNVQWSSAAGTKRGTVKNLYLDLAADNKMHTWMTIEFATPRGTSTVTIEAGEGNLKAMRVEKVATIETKMVKNLMSGLMMEIPKDTPHCCDPSTETFWSM